MEDFQLLEWGSFWAVDLQGEGFFAAYTEGGHLAESSIETDLTKSSKLSRVLIDDVDDRVFTSGMPLELEEGTSWRSSPSTSTATRYTSS